MEFFKHNTKIDFMGQRKWAAFLSILMFTASIIAILVYGLNWGLDFTGGTQIEARFPQAVNFVSMRNSLADAGFEQAVVMSYGSSNNALITLAPQKHLKVSNAASEKDTVVKKVAATFPDATIVRADYIGPQVGAELASKGLLAVVLALIVTMIYIGWRFEKRFAISSTVALIHDPILILGIFAYTRLEFNLVALAAILTVIGFSLNDTVVIFDRVRENFRKMRKAQPVDVLNLSTNQTLSRTIITSGLTLMVVFMLFFFGGSMIHSFAAALIIGIIVGTYSSIYVAGSLALSMGLKREHLLVSASGQYIDDKP